jgi:hypothetical protein
MCLLLLLMLPLHTLLDMEPKRKLSKMQKVTFSLFLGIAGSLGKCYNFI